MPKYIEVGKDIIEFPDSMSDAQIEAVLRSQYKPPAPLDDESRRLANRAVVAKQEAQDKAGVARAKSANQKARATAIKRELATIITSGSPDGVSVVVDDEAVARKQALEAELNTLEVGTTGANVGAAAGGISGAMAGAQAGVMAGALVFGPPGAAVGGILGGILGSLAGSSAGTALGTQYDLSEAKKQVDLAPVLTEEQATALLKDRLVENAIVDVGGNLLFFAGGKVLGKTPAGRAMVNRVRAFFGNPAKAEDAAQAMFDTTTRAEATEIHRAARVDKRLQDSQKLLPEGQLLDPTKATAVDQLSHHGVLPTPGEITGRVPAPYENFLRGRDDHAFTLHRQDLADAALRTAQETPHEILDVLKVNVRPQLLDPLRNARTLEDVQAAVQALQRGLTPQEQAALSNVQIGGASPMQHLIAAKNMAEMALRTVPTSSQADLIALVTGAGAGALLGGLHTAAAGALVAAGLKHLIQKGVITYLTHPTSGFWNQVGIILSWLGRNTQARAKEAAVPQAVIAAVRSLGLEESLRAVMQEKNPAASEPATEPEPEPEPEPETGTETETGTVPQ
jgi:hypothetical protein